MAGKFTLQKLPIYMASVRFIK